MYTGGTFLFKLLTLDLLVLTQHIWGTFLIQFQILILYTLEERSSFNLTLYLQVLTHNITNVHQSISIDNTYYMYINSTFEEHSSTNSYQNTTTMNLNTMNVLLPISKFDTGLDKHSSSNCWQWIHVEYSSSDFKCYYITLYMNQSITGFEESCTPRYSLT